MASWQSYQSYIREVAGLILSPDLEAKAAAYQATVESLCWWWPGTKVCYCSERPQILAVERRVGINVLHSDKGPAALWPDGWSLWFIHGVEVDEQIVQRPHSQTLDQIKQEKSEEVRRVRIERFGWDRYLRETGAKPRDRRRNDRDCQDEELFRLEDGTQRFLCVDPSTGRKYALGVPRDVQTCEQAQNWVSSGLDQYAVHRS